MLRTVLFAVLAITCGWLTATSAASSVVDYSRTRYPADTGASRSTPQTDDTEQHDQPLAIIGIADGTNKQQGRALTWALRRTLDLSIEWKSVEIRLPAETLFVDAQCPPVPNNTCLSKIGFKYNLPHFIWGILKLERGRVTAHLGLFDHDTTTATAVLEYRANMIDSFDDDLLRLANTGLTEILGNLHFPVLVRSCETSGSLVIDDVVVGQLTRGIANVPVTAGDHQFKLVLPDATVIAHNFQVRVKPGNAIRLDFMNIPET